MSQTATARSELIPLHSRSGLLPSAMPRDSTLAVNSPAKGLGTPAGPSGAGVAKPSHSDLTGKLGMAGLDARQRAVLARVNPNIAGSLALNHASGSTSTLTPTLAKRPVTRQSSKSIPRPPPTPDVFAPEAARSALGKRAREPAAATAVTATAKRSRAEAERLAANHREHQQQWLDRWQRVFPTLVFHFEIGVEDRGLRSRVTKLGARIDQFFSQRVSHLIVKNAVAEKSTVPARRGVADPDNPFLDRTGETDLAAKAAKLGIKVWSANKLAQMINKLDPVEVTNDADSLSKLLAQEKLHGTRERDFSAPRPDYYYFKPGYKYLLVEDATGRNRPIMVKEYAEKEMGWPEVHETFLKWQSSLWWPSNVKDGPTCHKGLRERAWALYVDQRTYDGEEPPEPSLKRSSSMRTIALTPLPENVPYDKASGNSVVLTSNVASTSAANHTPGYVNGMPQLGANRDRAIMQMSKRVQVLKGNARAAGKKAGGDAPKVVEEPAAAVPLPKQENRAPESVARMPTTSRRKSTGTKEPIRRAPLKEFLSQAQVVAMLKQLRCPTSQTKPSYQERYENREKVNAGMDPKDQDTSNGYCENCRVRYTDLSIHMVSKRHRRFAQNPSNFADLDDMLQCIQRPPNPLICVPTTVCRPCDRPHGRDEACGRCMDDPELYSSPVRSQPGSARKEYGWQGGSDDSAEEGSMYSDVGIYAQKRRELLEQREEEMEDEGVDGEEEEFVDEGAFEEAAEAADLGGELA